jgi:hypothetical protein
MDPGEIVNAGLTVMKVGAAAAGASIPFTALARRMLGPAADEVAEMMRDSIRVYRYQRQLNLLHKAEAMTSKAGYTPETVSLKLLFPLLEGASLEENEDLHTMWAALLAHASHPGSVSLVLPSFTEVLRVLTVDEARLLDTAYKYALSQLSPGKPTPSADPRMADAKSGWVRVHITSDAKSVPVDDHFTKIDRMKRVTLVKLGTYRDLFNLFVKAIGSAQNDLVITANSDQATSSRDLELRYKFDVAAEELQRLQMWSVVAGKSSEHFYLSSFGCQFMTVCNPPEPRKKQD